MVNIEEPILDSLNKELERLYAIITEGANRDDKSWAISRIEEIQHVILKLLMDTPSTLEKMASP